MTAIGSLVRKSLLALGLGVAACTNTITDETTGDQNDPGGNTNPNPNTSYPSFSTPVTYFADHTSTLNPGAAVTQGFTLSASTTFVFRFASQYTASAAIIGPGSLNAFTNGQAYTAFIVFNNQFGTQTVTLGPGSYYVGVRNQTANSSNAVRYELDYRMTIPAEKGYSFSFVDAYSSRTQALNNGAWYVQPITIQNGYRYMLDGANVNTAFYVMAQNEVANFTAGRTFLHYPSLDGSSPDQPGLIELKLPPGDYALAFRNESGVAGSFTFTLDRWRIF